jgi:hypothetical protein
MAGAVNGGAVNGGAVNGGVVMGGAGLQACIKESTLIGL